VGTAFKHWSPLVDIVHSRLLDITTSCSYIVSTMAIEFVWDSEKAKANVKKHGVTFEEARTVFYDEQAVLFYDEPHSDEDDRFLLLGLSAHARLLLVCHC